MLGFIRLAQARTHQTGARLLGVSWILAIARLTQFVKARRGQHISRAVNTKGVIFTIQLQLAIRLRHTAMLLSSKKTKMPWQQFVQAYLIQINGAIRLAHALASVTGLGSQM